MEEKTYEETVWELLDSLDKILEKNAKERVKIRQFARRHPLRYLKWKRSEQGKEWIRKDKIINGRDPLATNMIM